MNEITINSRDAAKMVEKEHKELLRDMRGYIKNMEKVGERKIAPSDFFIESTYIDVQNKVQPCYEITRKGCEFISNKLTGQKGTIFTASYINRFHEMESNQKIQLQAPYDTVKAFSLGEVSNTLKVLISVMNKQNCTATDVAEQVELTCEQFGIKTISNFVKPSPYNQLTLQSFES